MEKTTKKFNYKHDIDMMFSAVVKDIKKDFGKEAVNMLDFSAPIIKRRKQALLNFLPIYQDHFSGQFQPTELARILMIQNISIGMPIEEADLEFHFTMAAALWIMDTLQEQDCLQNLIPKIENDFEKLNQINIPELTDTTYTIGMIKGVMTMIYHRNGAVEKGHEYLNEKTAFRKPTSLFSPIFQDLISMIPDKKIKHAISSFEFCFWQFQENLLNRIQVPYDQMDCYLQQHYELMKKAEELPEFKPRSDIAKEIETSVGLMIELESLHQKILDEDEKIKKISYIAKNFPLNYLTNRVQYDEKILEDFEHFSVDDPFEIAFAYLYLVETGSDLPWLYNSSVAVLQMAARFFPWTAFCGYTSKKEYLQTLHDETGENHDFVDPDFSNNECSDFNKKLYHLQFPSDFFYETDTQPEHAYPLNFSQLVFGMTNLVLPRTVYHFQDLPKAITENISPDALEYMKLYLQLAAECRQPLDHIREIRTVQIENEDMKKELTQAQAQIKQLKKDILSQERKNHELSQKLEEMLLASEEEKQELADLREIMFHQANEQEQEPELELEEDFEFPCEFSKHIAVFGGHDTWVKVIRPLFPSVIFVPKEQIPNTAMIRNQDSIWLQANSISHSDFYKIISVARTNHIPVHYFGFASAKKCAIQLVQTESNSN